MLEVRFTQASQLKCVFDALKEVVEGVNVECDDSGISVQALDSNHVALIDLKMRKNDFESFRCDEPCTLGVLVSHVAKVMRLCPADGPLVLKRTVEDDQKLSFISDFDATTGACRTARISLMTVENDRLCIPAQQYPVEIEIPTRILTQVIRDLGVLADTIKITISKDTIRFHGDSESGAIENVFYRNRGAMEGCVWRFDFEREAGSQCVLVQEFAIRYLKYLLPAWHCSETASFFFAVAAPAKVTFKLGNVSHLSYYLAPKMNDD